MLIHTLIYRNALKIILMETLLIHLIIFEKQLNLKTKIGLLLQHNTKVGFLAWGILSIRPLTFFLRLKWMPFRDESP